MSSELAVLEYKSEYEVLGCTQGYPQEPQVDPEADRRTDDSLRAEITRAEEMVGHPECDDDVLAYSRESLDRAIVFLRAQASQFRKMYNSHAPVPQIGPGPDGSVDLHWKQKSWELLVNIPSKNNEMASFYGDDYGVQIIKGTLEPRIFNYGIIAWLTHK